MVCEYGCGQEANFRIGKRQRACCSETFLHCPSVFARANDGRIRAAAKKWPVGLTTVCCTCKAEKDTKQDFCKKRNGRPYSQCKECGYKVLKAWEKANPDRVREACRKRQKTPKIRAYKRKQKQDLREEVVKRLGGRCSWPAGCDWIDPRALQVDHVFGGGSQELKSLKKDRRRFYLRVLEDTTGAYRLLCANHNTVKKYESCEGVGQDHPLARLSDA